MLIALAIVLILAILGWLIAAAALNTNAICLFGHKYGDNGVCTRCGADKPSDEEKPDDNGGAVITDGEESNMFLASRRLLNSQYDEYGISPQAESAYTLTATVDSDDEDLSRLEWELQFVNPSSAWATDKTVTDYITINVAEDTHSATVSCMQAFGEQIKVVVKATYNLSASASCTIDYVKRATAINYSVKDKEQVFFTSQSDNYNSIVFTPEFRSTGTIEPSITDVQFNKLELYLDNSNPFTGNFEAACRNEFNFICTTSSYVDLSFSNKQSVPNCLSFMLMPNMLFQSADTSSAKYKMAVNKAAEFIRISTGRTCRFRVTFDIVYGGTVIQSGVFSTSSFGVIEDRFTPYIVVNEISLSNSSLVF